MNAILKHPIPRNLIRTIVYLCLGSGLTLLLLAVILVALGLNETNNFAVFFLIMGVSVFVGGSLWARSVLRNFISGNTWRAALLTGLAFGISVFLSAYVLELIERDLFYRNLLNAPGSHMQFVALFSIGIFLVAGLTSTVFAAQTTDMRQALWHGLTSAAICVTLFILVDLLMYISGWRVGDPDFPERSTMLTVMSLGLSVSLVLGGTLIGIRIEQISPSEA
jgi:hypothetical protein